MRRVGRRVAWIWQAENVKPHRFKVHDGGSYSLDGVDACNEGRVSLDLASNRDKGSVVLRDPDDSSKTDSICPVRGAGHAAGGGPTGKCLAGDGVSG